MTLELDLSPRLVDVRKHSAVTGGLVKPSQTIWCFECDAAWPTSDNCSHSIKDECVQDATVFPREATYVVDGDPVWGPGYFISDVSRHQDAEGTR